MSWFKTSWLRCLSGSLFTFLLVMGSNATAQTEPTGTRLADLANPLGFSIGGVLHGYDDDWNTADYLTTAQREFNTITATSYMAYGAWPDQRKSIDTLGWERVVDWATNDGKLVHGHVLVYPKANEDLRWWQRLKSKDVEATLQQFVTTLASSRAGDVWVWDVVNEAMADDGEAMDNDGLRTEYKEYDAIGPDYVNKAFQWAEDADPNALLILNDYGTEEINPKSDRLFAYVNKLKAAGVPIDGVGFQMHHFDAYSEPDYASIAANFQRFADSGFSILITECDVAATWTDSADDVPSAIQLARQKHIYKQITQLALAQPACQSLLLWDFADERSWLHPDGNGLFSFPTPFSGGRTNPIVAKPGYYGIQEALTGTPDPEPEDPNGFVAGTPYVITSSLDPSSGYLIREGDAEPSATVRLESIDSVVQPTSVTWTLEHVDFSVYRIACSWGSETGYLSRTGVPSRGTYVPSPGVYVGDLNEEWESQLWFLEAVDGGFLLHNGWNPDDGVLTRDAKLKGKQPRYLDTVSLQEPSDFVDQIWTISPSTE